MSISSTTSWTPVNLVSTLIDQILYYLGMQGHSNTYSTSVRAVFIMPEWLGTIIATRAVFTILCLHRYFSALILAQLVTTSLSLIPDEYIHKIFLFLKYFLRRADHVVLHAEENINSFFWFTLLPHMTLAYCPLLPAYDLTKQLTTSHPRMVVRDLRLCCIELGIVSLQNMLQGERHQKVLIEEGLVDFVTCMPWHLPERTVAHARACQLTASLKPILRQPPSLLNIARAKLATTCFGLDCIMKKTVRELLVTT